jgi:soluble lytic murein transglycosylase-like protein
MARVDFATQEGRRLVRDAATRKGLDALLVAAMVMVESSGKSEAVRPEPGYRWLWDVRLEKPFRRLGANEDLGVAPADFPGGKNEWDGQRASHGLLQVMGAVAREYRFRGPFAGLYVPEVGLDYGCRHLAKAFSRWGHLTLEAVLSAYNAGHPVEGSPYPGKVIAWVDKLGPLFEPSL